MKLTLSVIKADIGSIGGHIAPSAELLRTVRHFIATHGAALLLDSYVGSTGDDIAILMTHRRGEGDAGIHKLAWDAFVAGTATAKQQGLYGAGQDLLRESFAGNVRGMGPAVAEMQIDERASEPFLLLAALERRFLTRAPARQAAVA
jgi:fructose 1,6-bisphosphate aldolase/phosphatase